MSERRSVWNAVALVATLGLAAVVAVVAVTRSDHQAGAPAPSVSPSPTPVGSITPGGLDGDGPYIVYATKGSVFAYDIASGSTTALGAVDGTPVTERSRQPGSGRVVAFPTQDGSIYKATRAGLARIGAVPAEAGDVFEGSALSTDDRRMAIAALAPDLATVVVDLSSGHSTVIERKRRGQYPKEALLPIAWSLGGGIVYEIPYCRCDAGSPGLFSLDTDTGTSTAVTAARTTHLFRLVVSASGQSLYYGAGTSRRCAKDEQGPCEGPPYFLRRLASGQRGVETVRRASDASFVPATISPEGRSVLVIRFVPGTLPTRVERYGPNGERRSAIRGIPSGADPVALLPTDIVVATTTQPWSIVVVHGGRSDTIVRTGAPEEGLLYLGWLQ